MQQPNETAIPKPSLYGFQDPVTGLTHVMTNEDREARLLFIREFVKDLDPWGRAELYFARSVALDSWRQNRLRAVEENMFAYGQVLPDKHFDHDIVEVEHAIGHAHTFMLQAKAMNMLSLCESRLNRGIKNNLDLLLKLQATRSQRKNNSQTKPAAELQSQTATAGATAAATTEDQPKAA